MHRVSVSVVIINKNETEVEFTLKLLANQVDAPDFEVIVVDASDGKLDYIYNQFGFIRKIPYLNTSGKKITIPEQRNVGIKAAQGNVVVFIDAGCEPVNRWLKYITDPILKGSESIVAGGTLSAGGRTAHDAVYYSLCNKKYRDYAPTINLALDAKVFKKTGYFDETLPAGEDVDFTWRARSDGYRIRNMQKALVTHDWGDFRREAKRGFRYGKAEIELCRKHHRNMLDFIKRKTVPLAYVCLIVALPLAWWFPWYLLFILVPIVKNYNARPLRALAFKFSYSFGLVKALLFK